MKAIKEEKIKKTQRPRKDKLKNKVKVIKSVLKDPLATQQEIADKNWISVWNVNNKLKDIEKSTKECTIIDKICEQDKEIMQLVNGISLKKIKAIKTIIEVTPELVTTNEVKTLSDIATASTRRYTLFKWDITNDEGWLKSNKEVNAIPIEDLTEFLNELIK